MRPISAVDRPRTKSGKRTFAADQVVAFSQLCCIVALDTETALLAAESCRKYKLDTADAIIFASAQINGASLITCDSHFDGLPGVTVIKKI